MSAPIVSLPRVVINNNKVYEIESRRTNQSKPYNLTTGFTRKRIVLQRVTGSMGWWTPDTQAYVESEADVASLLVSARNKAYERFVSKLGENSSLGATLTAERRETYGMIRGFVLQMWTATRHAKRGNLRGVMSALNFHPPTIRVTRCIRRKGSKSLRITEEYFVLPDGKRVLKTSANAWLLWSYGVSPLISDVQNATEVFIRALPSGIPVRSTAQELLKLRSSSNRGGTQKAKTQDGVVRVGMQSWVTVTNHDLWLANQLGLVNPLQFVNEAIPFSFVVDWASNWSSVINSLTDFVGLSLTQSSTSSKIALTERYVTFNNPPYPLNYGEYSRDFLYFSRDAGITRPTFQFRYERFSWQRALNAISLLVGFLPK